jgi:hypothetical protein
VWEVPVAVNRYCFWHLPLLSGFALRLLPVAFLEKRLADFNAEIGPAVVHLHPWELEHDGPEPVSVPLPIRALKRVGRRRLGAKLERLFVAHRFGSIACAFPEVVASAIERSDIPSR